MTKKANDYLKTDHRDLQSVFAKVKQLDELNRKVLAYLDPTISKYCQVANVTTSRLILIAANGSVATQIRFQTLDLIRKFKQDPLLQKIQDIQCKVRPVHTLSRLDTLNKTFSSMQPLSPETAQIIKDIAESIHDAKLREIMKRIAERVKTSQSDAFSSR